MFFFSVSKLFYFSLPFLVSCVAKVEIIFENSKFLLFDRSNAFT